MNVKQNLAFTGILIAMLVFSCNASKKLSSGKNAAFEGKITYDLSFEDKTGEMSKKQAQSIMGDQQVYTIKGGKYKSEMNGGMNITQYYLGQDTLFSQMKGMNGLLWNDARVNPDEIISYDIQKGVATIAGLKCDLLTIQSKEGTTQYYFNKNYRADPAKFALHEYGFWKFCIEKTGALPMKSVFDTKEFHMEIVAKDFQAMEVSESAFTLPNLPRVKNPDH